MKFNCSISEKELKKIFLKKRSKTNAIYIGIFSAIFLVLFFEIIMYNLLFMTIIYLICLLMMLGILYIVNIIFTNILFNINNKKGEEVYGSISVEANDTALIEEGNFSTFKVDYKDVIYSKFKKNYFMIVDKKTSLLLKRTFFENTEDFDKLSMFIKEKVKVK